MTPKVKTLFSYCSNTSFNIQSNKRIYYYERCYIYNIFTIYLQQITGG